MKEALLQLTAAAAEPVSIDFVDAIKSIGIGSILAMPFIYLWLKSEKRETVLQDKIEELYAKIEERDSRAISRERQIADDVTPVVRESTQALEAMLRNMDVIIDKAEASEKRNQEDVLLRRLENIYSEVTDALKKKEA